MHGILVHSCLVRDPGGTAFQLIDDRGYTFIDLFIKDKSNNCCL